jgi:hypothetical protein
LVQISPPEVQQGRTALLQVTASRQVTRLEAVFNATQFPLYFAESGKWVGLLPADINAPRGDIPLTLLAWEGETQLPPQSQTVPVIWGAFQYQDLGMPFELTPLLDPALNAQEEDTLLAAYSRYTPEKWWRGSLIQPVPGGQISDFGGIRNYNNGVLESRHTGTDYRAGLGEPIMAAGDGRVVYANFTPIRGNHVIIDHGLGLLTGYSHMSEIYVVVGQRVLQSETIGLVGSTGRSQGAHMHFEVVLHGSWVDPAQFLTLPIPEQAPPSEGNVG